jgi:hypothetical protein
MARQRNYRDEYRRRVERALARGLSRSAARGHSRKTEQPAAIKTTRADSKAEAAIRRMNRGESMTAAARAARMSVERLRRVLAEAEIGRRNGRRWTTSDNRPRRVPVITDGRVRVLIADGYPPAQLAGAHHHAVGEFVRTNDLRVLKPFEGRYVRAVSGRKYPLETDPNELHRIAAMDLRPFHEIYEIVSTT